MHLFNIIILGFGIDQSNFTDLTNELEFVFGQNQICRLDWTTKCRSTTIIPNSFDMSNIGSFFFINEELIKFILTSLMDSTCLSNVHWKQLSLIILNNLLFVFSNYYELFEKFGIGKLVSLMLNDGSSKVRALAASKQVFFANLFGNLIMV